ncbi:hypothetical protein DL771_003225 [Monosporascus sp. 5C6A]|nr:hypothetical protein DL771_003225 [Monosporascus sp. 5C6A]
MLVLIAGIIGINPDKPSEDLSAALEGFVKMTDAYDLAVLQKAVERVGALICAFPAHPEAVVEGQLLLRRAGERAGVKTHGSARPSSPSTALRAPPWSGELAHLDRPKIIDAMSRVARYLSDGTKGLLWTSADDLAAYTIEAGSEPGAADGARYGVQSFPTSPLEMMETYERGRGVRLERQSLGSLSEVEDMLAQARASTPPSGHPEYIWLTYPKYMVNGTWDYETPGCEPGPGIK